MKKLVVTLVLAAIVLPVARSANGAQLLIPFPMWVWNNDTVYVTCKSYTLERWDIEMFGRIEGSEIFYVPYPPGFPYPGQIFFAFMDPLMNRAFFLSQNFFDLQDWKMWAYAYSGGWGDGVHQYRRPVAMATMSPVDAAGYGSLFYNVYIADRNNNRVVYLKYFWRVEGSPLDKMQHQTYLTHPELEFPIDLDVSNNRTWMTGYDGQGFIRDDDNIVWVAAESNRIFAFDATSGAVLAVYGFPGAGTGQFQRLESITCGRSIYNHYVNNDTVYVADSGNDRIVMLRWNGSSLEWIREWNGLYARYITDLDTDAFGHLWAVTNQGTVLKFRPNLQLLGHYGSEGFGLEQLYQPVSLSTAVGYWGGGNMTISERWTDSSGIRWYAIATDITDLHAFCTPVQGSKLTTIVYNLCDWSDVRIQIFSASGQLQRDLFNGQMSEQSGVQLHTWDGLNQNSKPLPDGDYRISVTATSRYRRDSIPVNTVTKEVWVTLCPGDTCTWLVGDADGNGSLTISDMVYITSYIFAGGPPPTPHPVGSGDADCSGTVTISDANYLNNYIFGGGPPPQCDCSNYR